jgi:hypothetical protein
VKNNREVLQHLKRELPCAPANPALGIWFLQENWNQYVKEILTPPCISNTIHNSQGMESDRVSINRWVDKENVTYIYCVYICIYVYIYIINIDIHMYIYIDYIYVCIYKCTYKYIP